MDADCELLTPAVIISFKLGVIPAPTLSPQERKQAMVIKFYLYLLLLLWLPATPYVHSTPLPKLEVMKVPGSSRSIINCFYNAFKSNL